MFMQQRKLALVSAIALSLATLTVPAFAADTRQELVDARQESQISTTYALSPYLRADDIGVAVHNGKAVLTGHVPEDVNKELAKQLALGVDGITHVDNRITVQSDYVAPISTQQRRYGEIVDDATIATAIRSKLTWSRYPNGMDTQVRSRSGKVTLTGSVESEADKALVTRLAMNTRGVRSVDNQLSIAKAVPTTMVSKGKPSSTAAQDVADGWITAKVKSTFMYSSNVDSADISVSTSNGIVTLGGRTSNGAERALAIELAQNVRGVKSVNSQDLSF